MIRQSRPLRALAGLGVGLAVWIAVRLPAMQQETQILALLAQPAPVPALRPSLATGTVPAGFAPPLLVARPDALPVMLARIRPAPAMRPMPVMAGLAAPRMATPVAAHVRAIEPPVPAPDPAPPPGNPAVALAERGYALLRAGQRRDAAGLLDEALAIEPGNRQWKADARALRQRWQLSGYALLRNDGTTLNQPGSGLPGFAASPALGGGQVGASVAWLIDPYARRPLALVARANVATDGQGVRSDTAQLAVGLRQNLLPGVSISLERLIPVGNATTGAFTARLAAGGRLKPLGQRLEAYGEAGVLDNGVAYAGGQARARLIRFGPAALYAASWASLQTGSPDVWRVDVGPSIAMQIKAVRLEADWRQKVGGNASPGSGPALTLSAGF